MVEQYYRSGWDRGRGRKWGSSMHRYSPGSTDSVVLTAVL